ncbi:MAG: hypothetical protein J0M12_09570 [Deltaproteobacteria bacterium]|nr:hypothetical protein [Deltaproteobacteria bacterium]
MKNTTLSTFISQIEKLEIGADFSSRAEVIRADALRAFSSSPVLNSLSSVSKSAGPEIVADCVLLLGALKAMQHRIRTSCAAEWKEPQLGQARAHAYVDIWGRTDSLLSLLENLLEQDASLKPSQILARFEVLSAGIKQALSDNGQLLMLNGDGAVVGPFLTWALARWENCGFKQLNGSILKELHTF